MSGCEYGYRSPALAPPLPFVLVPTSAEPNSSVCTCEGTQEADALSSPADCWDVIALTEGDSSCHACQTTGPAAYQTAGYGVTGDMLNQPLKRNHCQCYMAADNQSSQGGDS